MDVREKLVELANDVLQYLPWGEIQKDTAERIADRMMDQGVTVQEWISVKDNHPNEGEMILVCAGGQVGEAFLGYNGFCWANSFAIVEKVTHWMPLPQPPKGE